MFPPAPDSRPARHRRASSTRTRPSCRPWPQSSP